ncbi:MAG: MarR family transcriptional regulator [Rothia sp. (in: high G+C Gram-positive bacteria)]|uniref:MarR family winged helix-turn-helix transcriptional regulator n=1 Tax=Rothia sp. (in: high G+C Gram-positive bacteria) TaxID=1885016 RepID=UPI0026E066D4|nr:MarR family transcriptional regulator [Rothia sp. (in: high G+C Gram-positive bacteria)]MDO5749896.1 MarR family transcriptional regulator [Rothia sp. (in: high G+C Gram-positive bacteria)]
MSTHYAPEPCDFGWSLTVLAQRYEKLTVDIFAALPKGMRGYHVLYTVVSREPETQQEISEYLGLDRAALVQVIHALEEQGLIYREVDPQDKRIRIIKPTPAGTELLAQIQQQLSQAETRLFDGLSLSESHILRLLTSDIANAWKNR